MQHRTQHALMAALALVSAVSAAPTSPPAILVHKQALNEDGSFNYVFAADNGLRQGERILADGARLGAYSYVDPSGEVVSVKYRAGKDGFWILEGSHTPPSSAGRPLGHNHHA